MSNRRRPAAEPAAVTIAYVHPNEVTHSWHQSIVDLIGYDMAREGRVMRGGCISIRCGTEGLPAARNQAAAQFLERDDAEWLFWIDTDMGFSPDIVERLIEAADPEERPMVGALCFAQRELTPDGMGGYRVRAAPTIYDWVKLDDKQGFMSRRVYDPDTLMRCQGTGSAAILIHRSVFEKVRDKFGPVWYDRAPDGNISEYGSQRLMGEDLSFCMRIGALDIPVYVHTGIKTTHLKNVWLAEADYLEQFTLQRMRDEASKPPEDDIGDATSA